MKRATLSIVLLLCMTSVDVRAFQIQKSALFVFLHEVKPIEEQAAEALEEKDYALALRKYREALRGYEKIWKDHPNLPDERPYGIDRMVDESIECCKKVIEDIKDKGEAQDKFYQKLNQLVQVDFSEQNVHSVAKSLTFLTDVNIIVDETALAQSNGVLNSHVSLRTDNPLPLRTIITRICQQIGLAYSIQDDHVFISTRVKLDEQE